MELFSHMKLSWFFALFLVLGCRCWGMDTTKGNTLLDAGITDLQLMMGNGELTSVQLVEYYLQRIRAYDQQHSVINAIIRINPNALAQAAELDMERLEKTINKRPLAWYSSDCERQLQYH